jgi:Metal-sensitive transcriptional repressor
LRTPGGYGIVTVSRNTHGGYPVNGGHDPQSRGDEMTETTPAVRHEHSYIHNNTKDDYLKRLRRIEGQARGLQRMVE